MTTTALQPSLFRFVQVRRLGPPAPPPPPPPDLPLGVFDFSDALLEVVIGVIRDRDRETGAALAASLLGQLSPASTRVTATLRRMLSRVATNELTTLGDLRSAPDGDVAGTPRSPTSCAGPPARWSSSAGSGSPAHPTPAGLSGCSAARSWPGCSPCRSRTSIGSSTW